MTRKATDFDLRLGRRIREVRLSHGLTQDELGKIAGVTFQQIQKFENGHNRVSPERLDRISKKLNVPVGVFFGEFEKSLAKPRPVYAEDTIRLASEIHKLPNARIVKSMIHLTREVGAAWKEKSSPE